MEGESGFLDHEGYGYCFITLCNIAWEMNGVNGIHALNVKHALNGANA